jgi:hypothetical protein
MPVNALPIVRPGHAMKSARWVQCTMMLVRVQKVHKSQRFG